MFTCTVKCSPARSGVGGTVGVFHSGAAHDGTLCGRWSYLGGPAVDNRRVLFPDQDGIVSRRQALAAGISRSAIANHLRQGHWQWLYLGVFATFNGPLPRPARLWAAVLFGGSGAVLSHDSAAEVWGFAPPSNPIHITVPADRHRRQQAGDVIIHRSAFVEDRRHPARRPPRTRVEATIFDMVETARAVDDVVAAMTDVCGTRLTTPERLRRELTIRSRSRWRRELEAALDDVGAGARSLLERRYLTDVERRHALPNGTRQAPHAGIAGKIYDDVRYADQGVVVELDGRAVHRIGASHRDLLRDNIAGARGESVLHFGWDDVTNSPCAVAKQVADVLTRRGWSGRPRPCRRADCKILGN